MSIIEHDCSRNGAGARRLDAACFVQGWKGGRVMAITCALRVLALCSVLLAARQPVIADLRLKESANLEGTQVY